MSVCELPHADMSTKDEEIVKMLLIDITVVSISESMIWSWLLMSL